MNLFVVIERHAMDVKENLGFAHIAGIFTTSKLARRCVTIEQKNGHRTWYKVRGQLCWTTSRGDVMQIDEYELDKLPELINWDTPDEEPAETENADVPTVLLEDEYEERFKGT